MKKLLSTVAVSFILTGCATPPIPKSEIKNWTGGDENNFNRDYAECRLKADEKLPGVGIYAVGIIFWPVLLAGIPAAMDANNTLNMWMAGRGWNKK